MIEEQAVKIINKLDSGVVLDDTDLDFARSDPSINFELVDLMNRKNKGEFLSSEEENKLNRVSMPQSNSNSEVPIDQILNVAATPDKEKERHNFRNLTQKFSEEGGSRIIHITDTESSPEDLEMIMTQNLKTHTNFNKNKDVVVHTGDLLEDFINFKAIQGGDVSSFLTTSILKHGGLEGKIEGEELAEVYGKLLSKHGISEEDLKEGKINENVMRSLQSLYHGILPNFLNKEERAEYKTNFDKFKKHLKTAIENDARTKYSKYKKTFEKLDLSPEELILIEGNHDVPHVMREVLGEYMPAPGTVIERKGMRFGNPLNGSTGQHLGPEFVDTFGYTDLTEQIESIKQNSDGMQRLLNRLDSDELGLKGYFDAKDLSRLISVSQSRSAQGIGEGELVKYFNKYIKKEIDDTIQEKRGQVVSKVPKNVDFYLFHGQPNGQHKGLEEAAALAAIDAAGGGQILHGHMHGRTSHKYGNSILLNEGEGRGNFGVYHIDSNNKISDILSKNIDPSTGMHTFDIGSRDTLAPKKVKDGGYQ